MAAYPDVLPLRLPAPDDPAGIGGNKVNGKPLDESKRGQKLPADELSRILDNIIGIAGVLGLLDGTTTNSIMQALYGLIGGSLKDKIASGSLVNSEVISTNIALGDASSYTRINGLIYTALGTTFARTILVHTDSGFNLVPLGYPSSTIQINGMGANTIVPFGAPGLYVITSDGANDWTCSYSTGVPVWDYTGTLSRPNADEDETLGWAPGSLILASDGSLSFCRSAAAGAAEWIVLNYEMSIHNALSIIGNAVNSIGTLADILATNGSGGVLRENGGTLGFGAIAAAGHGTQSDGSLHAVATDGVAGFMSAADKTLIDNQLAPTGAYLDITSASHTADGSYALYGISHSAALCTITFATTNWPIGASRTFEKVNASTFTIVFAPPSGGTINGAAPDATMTAPGSGNVSATTRGNLFWVVTRTGANAFQVRGGQVQASQTNDSIIGGTGQANRFITTGSGSAGTPAFRLSDADSGFYWDATKGAVTSVNSTDRVSVQVNGATVIASGVASTTPSLVITSVASFVQMYAHSGSPEGAISAAVGQYAFDATNGRLYVKRTGSGNTGWVQIDRCESGTYTPIGTALINLDSVTPGVCRYIRVGDQVIVSGTATVDPTASGNISFALSLLIASAFTTATQASGMVSAGSSTTGVAYSDATNDRVEFFQNNTSSAPYDVRFTFTYTVL